MPDWAPAVNKACVCMSSGDMRSDQVFNACVSAKGEPMDSELPTYDEITQDAC